MEIKFKRYSENAVTPMNATVSSAGYDLYLVVDKTLIPFKTELVKTDMMLAISTCFYGKVVGRSGLALSGVSTHAGTIDSDFCGIACVILTNISHVERQIKKGERIGQIMFEKYKIVKSSECSTSEELPKTDRGSKSSGSTGA